MQWITYIPIRYDIDLYRKDAVKHGCIRPLRTRVLKEFSWCDTIIVCQRKTLDSAIAVGQFTFDYVLMKSSDMYRHMRKKGLTSQILDHGGKLIDTEYYVYVSGYIFEVHIKASTFAKQIFRATGGIGDIYMGGSFSPYHGEPVVDKPFFEGFRYLESTVGKDTSRMLVGHIEIIQDNLTWKLKRQLDDHQEDYQPVPDFG